VWNFTFGKLFIYWLIYGSRFLICAYDFRWECRRAWSTYIQCMSAVFMVTAFCTALANSNFKIILKNFCATVIHAVNAKCCLIINIYLCQSFCVIFGIFYLFVCLFVRKITQKVAGRFGRNFQGMLDLAQLEVIRFWWCFGLVSDLCKNKFWWCVLYLIYNHLPVIDWKHTEWLVMLGAVKRFKILIEYSSLKKIFVK